jgi:nitrite reductase/ring-hydroxylating ferredoxin subunit
MRKILIIIFAALTFISCGKTEGIIPSVPVNFRASKTDPRMAALNSAGGSVVISGYGVAGLLLYRQADGTYSCYDRCSSYQPEKLCAISPDATGFTATDPCSGAKFSLSDGSPVKAPAVKSLRAYTVNVSNFEIFVSN